MWVAINLWSLDLSIVQVVIIPLILGFLLQTFFAKQTQQAAKVLPLVSVITIVVIVAGVVAGIQNKIASTGLMIFAVVVLHNVFSFLLGFLFARLMEMNLAKQKAAAMEVGMQNSGLG